MLVQKFSKGVIRVVVISLLASSPNTAHAALQCGNHDKIVDVLEKRFKESRHVTGVVNSRTVMEIFMSQQGTWTIMLTDTSGNSCITSFGEAWQDVPLAVAGIDS